MTSETEEAVARVEGEAASLEAWSKTVHASPAERARHRRNAADLRTILSALSASQAEVERLGRERDEALALIGSDGADVAYQFGRAQAAEARATRAEEEIARRDAVAKASWGDQKDQHTDAILAAQPTYTKDFETYNTALAMVGNRHGKYELVNMANWLLARATRAEGLLGEAGEVLGPFAQKLDDIGDDEADDDAFREMSPEHRRAPRITVGHLRAARAFLDKLKEQG